MESNKYVNLLSVEENLWCAVTEAPFIHTGDDNIVKHPKDWTYGETNKASYILKARSIFIFTLSAKVFYSISYHTSAKGIWDTLQPLYEGKNDVKDFKTNMFNEEFELFCVDPEESVDSMQTRFLHLINKLRNLGKIFSKKCFTNKIFRSMYREW